jgi:hypothetical protein
MPPAFNVAATEQGQGTRFTITGPDGATREYEISGGDQGHYADFYLALSRGFGTRVPHAFAEDHQAAPGRPDMSFS